MNITVQVDEVSLASAIREGYDDDGPTLRTIGDEVASLLVQRIVRDNDVWPPFREAVTQIRDDLIREAVAPLIAEALGRPIVKTTPYGDPVPGAAGTTLAEIITDEARKALTAATGDSYTRDRDPLVRKLVAAEVQAAFSSVIADEVAKARDMVGDEIGEKVAAAVKAGMAAKR